MNAVVPGKWIWQPVFIIADDGAQFEILREFPNGEMIVRGVIKHGIKSLTEYWVPIWTREERDSTGRYIATALKRME